MLYEDARCFLNCFFRMDSAISYYFHDEFFEIRTLFNAGIFDSILYIPDRSVDRINCYNTEWSISRTIFLCRNIPTTFTDVQFHMERCTSLEVTYNQVRVHYLEVRQ